MATVNRYTQVRPAQYNPMSLEELMMVPGMKRQQHDELLNNVANTRTALAQADYMDIHGEQVSKVKQRLEDELTRQVDEVSANGITGALRTDFVNLHGKYQQETGPKGTIGAAQSAKQAYKTEMDTYIANATKEGYSPATAKMRWDEHAAKYKGFDDKGNITNIGGLYAPKYFDVADEVLDLAKVAGVHESDIANLNSNIILDDNGQYILNKGSRTINASNTKQLQSLVTHMNNQIMNPNSGLRQSLDHQGLTPADAIQLVAGIAPILSKTKTGTETQNTITGFKSAAELGVSTENGTNLNYEAQEATAVKVKHSDAINVFNDIAKGNPVPGQPDHSNVKGVVAGIGPGNFAGGQTSTKEISTIHNRFPPEVTQEFASIFERLQRTDPNLKGKTFDSKEGAAALGEYLNNNQNIIRQNVIITDDFSTQYGDNSVGIVDSDPKKIEDYVFRSIENRKFAVDGEVIHFNDMPEDFKKNYKSRLQYGGYASPKNFLAREFNSEEQYKNMFASPLKFNMQDEDGNLKTVYLSRSEGEMATPGYQADLIFNDVFTKTNEYPDIPYEINTADGPIEIVYHSATKSYTLTPDPVTSGYKVPMKLTESELQSAFYDSMGVSHPKSKKKK